MKKLIYLLLALLPFSAISQSDSILQLRMELGLNLMIVEPGEDPNGAQARPCASVVTRVGQCCYRYEVICGGVVKWQSDLFCNTMCGLGTIQNPRLLPFILATPENPVTASTGFDMSFLIDKESLTEEELTEVMENYNNFYFTLENDILIENEGLYVMYKAGNYKINQGEMIIRFYYTAY